MSYHYLRDSNQGCCDCLGDFFSGSFGESCSKSRLGMTLLFLWVIILTIVCIALGSNIGKGHVLASGAVAGGIFSACFFAISVLHSAVSVLLEYYSLM